MRRRISLLLLPLMLPGAVWAQGVRGQILERDSLHAATGIVVQLVDSTGAVVARALSGDAGQFALRAPSRGSFTLRALRIGYRPTVTGPVALRDGETTTFRIVLSGAPIELQPVIVSDTRVCRVNPDSGTAAARVWEAARTALTATVLTQTQRRHKLRVALFERFLNASGRHVEKEDHWESEGTGISPFKSVPDDTLARYGYVRREPSDITYYAPDPEILLSEHFARAHCFRLQSGEPGISGGADWIGLAFEPVEHDRADVQGVLWLDRRSAELRQLSYTYTAAPDAARRADAGGSEQFVRLPGGEWIIARWQIRMPMLQQRRESAAYIGSSLGGNDDLVLAGIKVSGGETLEVGNGDDVIWAGRRNAIAGMLADEHGVPAARQTRVRLASTSRATLSDSAGRFTFAHLFPGTYAVVAEDSLLDLLGLPHEVAVTVKDSGVATAHVPLLSPRAAVAAFCKGEASDPLSALLRLRVVDSTTGTPLEGARVQVAWTTAAVSSGDAKVIRGNREGTTDEHGLVWACGLPTGSQLTLRVAAADHRVGERTLTIPERQPFFAEVLRVGR